MTEDTGVLIKKKRAALRTAVTKYIQQLEKELKKNEPDDGEVEELLEHLSEKFESLKVVDRECETLYKPAKIDKELEVAEQYRDKTITWRFRAKKHLRKSDKLNSNCESGTATEIAKLSETINIKLPKINIPKFYGEINQWLSFWNSFKTAIHDNSSLSSIDKFTYLKGLLCSTALATVEGFAITAENYAKAVEILKDRFGRKDAIINSHVQKLLSVTPLNRSNDVKGLRQFFDICQTQIRSLESLGVAYESFSALLCPLILNCLPYDLVLEFNKETDGSEYKLEKFLKFLNKEISARERAESSFSAHISPHQNKISPERSSLPKNLYRDSSRVKFGTRKHSLNKNPSTIPTAANFIATSGEGNEPCVFCGQPSHSTSRCVLARGKSLRERKDILMKKGACFRCLKVSRHLSRDCKGKLNPCSLCGKRHHDLLCFSSNNSAKENNEKIKKDEDTILSNSSRSKEVLLQTLVVCIKWRRSDTFVRVIHDTGSQKSYISKFIAEKLQLKCMGEETTVHGLFGGIERSEKHKKYVVTLSDVFNSYSCEIEVMDQERICTPIRKLSDSELLNELKEHGIFVSDASMSESYCLFEREPNEIHILLGADVIGNLLKGEEVKHLRGGLVAVNTHLGWTVMGKLKVEKEKYSNVILSLYVSDNCIKDLWSLDVLGIKEPCEKKTRIELEEAARDHFARNVSRDEEGRYVVSLPWIQDHPPLSNCKNLAERRLKNCVRSLERSGNLGNYEAVFHSWLDEDIIEEVQKDADTKNEHYLSHHPVYKDNSTTKIRPVFDGSAKEKNSSSINECLEKGPNMVKLIPEIINKFRLRKFGITADTEKAFLQIGLQEDDKPFLRFLWWENGDKENTKIYQHKRVVFGISSSPFLLGATLEHNLKQVTGHLEVTAQKLLESFYVDNCVTSVDNEEELRRFMIESREILSPAKFNLRGWEHTGVSAGGKSTILEEEKKVPVLGLIWKPNKDTLSVNWEETSKFNETPLTKRKILSAVHRIFDPIGFTCPSEIDGTNTCQPVQARARVAPIKAITIPRLELLACTIGSRLVNTTKSDLGLEDVPICCWSGSVNVLYWIKGKENWGTFVNNKVQEIRRLTNSEDWKHIAGILNPADLPSRGCGAEELTE
ncbi:hypothetical protein AVEN_75944-1 [Araneus ventricosus]|uniref:Reverse transcriptase domain-containing protein n=1 Tax=Araneus ventricosus TaxID=182803 RepID=A0A4Y2M2Q4_ARAVE|nr:hypothetical protein AVEN_75944-1 [Araneus ventricosus]